MGETVIITGASRGIGRATAIKFAKLGYNVVINYNNSKAMAEELADSLASGGCSVVSIKADVSKGEQVVQMAKNTLERFGTIDVLVNNAGIAPPIGVFTDTTKKDWDRTFETNVYGTFNCAKAVLPTMINAKRGKIINISSIWGMTGASCEVLYSASKSAVIGFTKALAKEVGLSGICVNCVAPGVVDTDMNSNLSENDLGGLKEQTPLNIIGASEDIANAIAFLASSEADFITGQVISPNGGFLI